MTMRSSLRSIPALVSAALLVALVGCGSTTGGSTTGGGTTGDSSASSPGPTSAGTTGSVAPPAPTQASGPVDVCKLVTSADAQAALGKPVRPAKTKSLGPTGKEGASCTYESTDFANGTANGVALAVTFFPHSAMSKSQYDDTWRANGGKAVAGLGESAWLFAGILNIYDHGATLGVGIVSLKTEATLDKLEPVAKLALGRV
ncbi:MAG TPA: hypothetical protein VIM01_17900 [Dermatophilaceae bacterium]|jgi:hypothetical protein